MGQGGGQGVTTDILLWDSERRLEADYAALSPFVAGLPARRPVYRGPLGVYSQPESIFQSVSRARASLPTYKIRESEALPLAVRLRFRPARHGRMTTTGAILVEYVFQPEPARTRSNCVRPNGALTTVLSPLTTRANAAYSIGEG